MKTAAVTPDTIADMITGGQYEEAAALALRTADLTLTIQAGPSSVQPEWSYGKGYHPHWVCKLASEKGSHRLALWFSFWGSINDGKTNKRATPYDVLACLQWNKPGTFEDFCYEMGLNTDSIKAHKTWVRVRAEVAGLFRVVRSQAHRDLLAAVQ